MSREKLKKIWVLALFWLEVVTSENGLLYPKE
jgi:hypothetical protein